MVNKALLVGINKYIPILTGDWILKEQEGFLNGKQRVYEGSDTRRRR